VVTGGTPCPTTTPTPYGEEVDPYGSGAVVPPMYGYGKGLPPFWPFWWKWYGGFLYGKEDQYGTYLEQPYGGQISAYGPRPVWVRLNKLCIIRREYYILKLLQ